jgi:hypothetical protein
MRRVVVLLAAIGSLGAWLAWKRRESVAPVEQVTIGFTDGSSMTLEAGSPERERLVAAAGGVL